MHLPDRFGQTVSAMQRFFTSMGDSGGSSAVCGVVEGGSGRPDCIGIYDWTFDAGRSEEQRSDTVYFTGIHLTSVTWHVQFGT